MRCLSSLPAARAYLAYRELRCLSDRDAAAELRNAITALAP